MPALLKIALGATSNRGQDEQALLVGVRLRIDLGGLDEGYRSEARNLQSRGTVLCTDFRIA